MRAGFALLALALALGPSLPGARAQPQADDTYIPEW